ncbi:polysaccharide biosynthesis/export family protein [Persicobacter psychrovividus]|uniref:Capsule polysaccharide transporter n=1 Tax=Persicobacter psychrovividus TaxID=387638 RepID=A0ABN6LA65_9BACT|nr:capsule polysaccharide transporter [Persicobacter psychrovividus]
MLSVHNVQAQTVNGVNLSEMDFSKKNVDDLTDAQIAQIQAEMTKRGLTVNDIDMFAKAKGVPEAQVVKLKARLAGVSGASEVASQSDLPAEVNTPEVTPVYSEKDSPLKEDVPHRVFGSNLFNASNLTFEPSVALNPSKDYKLGIGDEVRIEVWGASQQNYRLLINKVGAVVIPDIGPISVYGLSLGAAEKKILKRLSTIFSGMNGSHPDTFAQVSMGQLQGITVNVIGEVVMPGTYTLPSTASLFNALYLSGGPNKIGSFRKVQVIRNGKIFKTVDVYDYLIHGNGSADLQLKNDDIIKVPTYDLRVVIQGQFKRNGLFEAKEGETLSSIIEVAGGFTENAYSHRLEIYRKNGREQLIKDVMQDQFSTTVLHSGDSIVAKAVLNRFANRVQIAGAVFRPGTFELSDGLMVSDLIKKAEGLKEDAYLGRAYIYRKAADMSDEVLSFSVKGVITGKEDVKLQREDFVTISSITDMRETQFVTVSGPVMHPGQLKYGKGMKLKDLILMAGGFKIEASGARVEVARRHEGEQAETSSLDIAKIYRMDITKDLKLSEEDGSFEIQPFDKIYIRKSPGYKTQRVVSVTGDVIYPGDYSLSSENERISDVIKRAGGFSANAYPEGAMLTRKIVKTDKQKALEGEMLKRDKSIDLTDLDFEVVGIRLQDIMANPGGKYDIFLSPGDEITVPSKVQTVRISGEVLNPVSTTYKKRKRAKFYIAQGGGFGLRAKKGKTYVRYPNGTTGITRGFIIHRYPKVTPGSEVIVPQKPERAPMSITAWMAIASTAATLALTVSNIFK